MAGDIHNVTFAFMLYSNKVMKNQEKLLLNRGQIRLLGIIGGNVKKTLSTFYEIECIGLQHFEILRGAANSKCQQPLCFNFRVFSSCSSFMICTCLFFLFCPDFIFVLKFRWNKKQCQMREFFRTNKTVSVVLTFSINELHFAHLQILAPLNTGFLPLLGILLFPWPHRSSKTRMFVHCYFQ